MVTCAFFTQGCQKHLGDANLSSSSSVATQNLSVSNRRHIFNQAPEEEESATCGQERSELSLRGGGSYETWGV